MLSTHRHDSSCCLPTEHEPLAVELIAQFDKWIDQELPRLEEAFTDYVTMNSQFLGEGELGQRI